MTDDTSAGRGTHALTTALADLTADAVEECTLEQVILYGLYTDGRSGYAGDLRRTIKPDDLHALLAENQAMRDAIEALKPWLIPLMEKYLRETIIPLWQALKPLVEAQADEDQREQGIDR